MDDHRDVLAFCQKKVIRMRSVTHVDLLSFVCIRIRLFMSHEWMDCYTIMFCGSKDILLPIKFDVALESRSAQ